MKRLFPIVAIVLTVVNAVRKIMDKRQLITTLYSKNWGGLWGNKLRAMKIPMETFIIGLRIRNGENPGIFDEKFYTWWEIQIPKTAPGGHYEYGQKIEDWGNEQIVDGRLGHNVRVELFEQIPWHAKEKVKEVRKGRDGYTKMAIRDIYSIQYFAKKHGYPSSFVYGVMKDFAVGLYRRMTMDGLYPPDVFV